MGIDEQLRLIKDVKKFAVKELGIIKNDSFTKKASASHLFVLCASEKKCIKPIFEDKLIDISSYNLEEITKEKKALDAKGYDTLAYKCTAAVVPTEDKYECPYTTALLKEPKSTLLSYVFHENWHIQAELNKINHPIEIEEAIADCFAYQGSLLYSKSNPQLHYHVKRLFNELLELFDFTNKYYHLLNKTYKAGSLNDAKKVMKKAKKEAEKIQIKDDINNAFFLTFRTYSTYARPVYEALKDIHPKDYTNNKRILNKALKGIKPS